MLIAAPSLRCAQTTALGGQEGEDWTDSGQDTGPSGDTAPPPIDDTGPGGDTGPGSDTDGDSGETPAPSEPPRVFSGKIRIILYAQHTAFDCDGPLTLEGDGTMPPLMGGWSCATEAAAEGLFPEGLGGLLQGQWVEGSTFGGVFVAQGEQNARWSATWSEGFIQGDASGQITTVFPAVDFTATFDAALQ